MLIVVGTIFCCLYSEFLEVEWSEGRRPDNTGADVSAKRRSLGAPGRRGFARFTARPSSFPAPTGLFSRASFLRFISTVGHRSLAF